MTMPHLMNCSHIESGWCLDCVKELNDKQDSLAAKLKELPADWWTDSSLKTWFPFTAQELDDLKAERDALLVRLEDAEAERDDANNDMVRAFAERDALKAESERSLSLIRQYEIELPKAKAENAAQRAKVQSTKDVLLRQLRSLEDSRPLCPDCRDKQRGKDCLGCTIQSQAATIQRYEDLIVNGGCGIDHNDTDGARWCLANHEYPRLHAEARAIQARRDKEAK